MFIIQLYRTPIGWKKLQIFFFANYGRKNLKIHENPKKSIFSKLPVEDLIFIMDKSSGNLKFVPKDNVSHLLRKDLREEPFFDHP